MKLNLSCFSRTDHGAEPSRDSAKLYASLLLVEIGELLALFRQPLQQRRGRPEFSVLLFEFQYPR